MTTFQCRVGESISRKLIRRHGNWEWERKYMALRYVMRRTLRIKGMRRRPTAQGDSYLLFRPFRDLSGTGAMPGEAPRTNVGVREDYSQ